jgi:hypothetical protein
VLGRAEEPSLLNVEIASANADFENLKYSKLFKMGPRWSLLFDNYIRGGITTCPKLVVNMGRQLRGTLPRHSCYGR